MTPSQGSKKKKAASSKASSAFQKAARSGLLARAVEEVRDYGIFLLDATGMIQTWNKGAEKIQGYRAQEILGKHFSTFYPKEAVASGYPDYELRQAKKHGRYEDEGWRICKDGTRFWASVIITKLTDRDGSLLGFSKVVRDLSERKAAEERLRESEMRFRMLIDGVKDYSIFMLDPDGVVTSWNEGAERISGYSLKEALGRHFSDFYSDEDIRAGKPAYELREAAVTGRFEDEGWRVRKDGSLLWASVIITAIRNPQRQLVGFSQVIRDLTERKRAEAKVQRAYEGLERKVQERTAELATANGQLKKSETELQEAVRVRDEFLSVASHELKTPITSLKMQLQMLRSRTRPEEGTMPPPERIASGLDTSLRQVDRLTALIEDLLDVARAQGRKLTYHFERSDLAGLVPEVVSRLQDLLTAARCRVEVDAPTPVIGHFDRFRMDQVLVNLLTNAMKYAPGTTIEISMRDIGGYARLVVRDRGPGIPNHLQEKIFERFERATHSRNVSGLGLGLYITKQIVEGHRGTIRVESVPGDGASFVIELPLNLVQVLGSGPAHAGGASVG